MGEKTINTNLDRKDQIHRIQKRNLKKRIEMAEKGNAVDELQKDYLRARLQELSQLMNK